MNEKVVIKPSQISLIVANLIPLIGVLFFDWKLYPIILLYWCENLVIGVFNIAKMARATGVASSGFTMNDKPYTPDMKTGLIVFFVLHYGIFLVVHGAFVSILFGSDGDIRGGFSIALLGLFISHGISYVTNYIKTKEYERVSAPDLFIEPYRRVIILHVVILFGGMIAKLLGAPIGALIILIAIKIWVDLKKHTWEHSTFLLTKEQMIKEIV